MYRQSVEALTKHRMAAVESVKPAGLAEWTVQAQELLKKHPKHFNVTSRPTENGTLAAGVQKNGRFFVVRTTKPELDERYQEWDGEEDGGGTLEGMRTLEEKKSQTHVKDPFEGQGVEWVDEPQLTIEQCVRPLLECMWMAFFFYEYDGLTICNHRIEEIENKVGAGLIEEVIQVAEGELKLVDTMVQGKV